MLSDDKAFYCKLMIYENMSNPRAATGERTVFTWTYEAFQQRRKKIFTTAKGLFKVLLVSSIKIEIGSSKSGFLYKN